MNVMNVVNVINVMNKIDVNNVISALSNKSKCDHVQVRWSKANFLLVDEVRWVLMRSCDQVQVRWLNASASWITIIQWYQTVLIKLHKKIRTLACPSWTKPNLDASQLTPKSPRAYIAGNSIIARQSHNEAH